MMLNKKLQSIERKYMQNQTKLSIVNSKLDAYSTNEGLLSFRRLSDYKKVMTELNKERDKLEKKQHILFSKIMTMRTGGM